MVTFGRKDKNRNQIIIGKCQRKSLRLRQTSQNKENSQNNTLLKSIHNETLIKLSHNHNFSHFDPLSLAGSIYYKLYKVVYNNNK